MTQQSFDRNQAIARIVAYGDVPESDRTFVSEKLGRVDEQELARQLQLVERYGGNRMSSSPLSRDSKIYFIMRAAGVASRDLDAAAANYGTLDDAEIDRRYGKFLAISAGLAQMRENGAI